MTHAERARAFICNDECSDPLCASRVASLVREFAAVERAALEAACRALEERAEFWLDGLGSTEGRHPDLCADEALDCLAIVRALMETTR